MKRFLVLIRDYFRTLIILLQENVGYFDNNERTMLLFAHSLEKGMCIDDPKINFGLKKALRLLNILDSYSEQDRNNYIWKEAYCSVGKYIEYSELIGSDISTIKDKYSKLTVSDNIEKFPCGINKCKRAFFYSGWNSESARNFMISRKSVRKFENRQVPIEVIKKILDLSLMAPSACNRQPSKVYVCNKSYNQIKNIIPGNKGFENEITNWMIITEDRNMFGWTEVLQCYVNGGIFINQLVLAMHSYNIESCIFQIPIGSKESNSIRKLLNISNNEAIIAAVGFGYVLDETSILCAERKKADDILILK